MNFRAESWIPQVLAERRAQGLGRHLVQMPRAGGKFFSDGREWLNFASNDYLNLAGHPAVLAASRKALDAYGAGAGASRLVSGNLPIHEELETRLAELKGYPSALVFGSGFLANAGIIPALVGSGDTLFADRLSHASLLDAALLSRARLHRFRHNDPGHLQVLLERHGGGAGRRLIVSESVFSMDGDRAPLEALIGLAERHNALLMIDEAHATGVLGEEGAGACHAVGGHCPVNLAMGTLSKALGNYGGFVACSPSMRDYLINHSRALIYTTALPPAVVGGALGALDVLRENPRMGSELLERADYFRQRLIQAGFRVGDSTTQIIPVILGGAERMVQWSARLREVGVMVPAIRAPTVPVGTERLRFSITLAHTRADLERAVQALCDTSPVVQGGDS
jgi:8-amino-7-oxononanoate synthase